MTDYTKLKNAELENLLKERGLPHSGKKADLISRLVEHDNSSTAKPTSAALAANPKPAGTTEDEIDWDEDSTGTAKAPAKTETTAATTATTTTASTTPAQPAASSEPAAAALAAGGKERVKNPLAVPNQIAAIDPSTTDDLTVVKDQPASETPATAAATAPQTEEPATTESATKPAAVPAAPAADFSSHMPATSIDEELAKRKARAARFGTVAAPTTATSDESIKALERAKRFGTDKPADGAADTTVGVGKLNEALPEKREKRKRVAETAEEQKTAEKPEEADQKRRKGPAGGATKTEKAGGEKKADTTVKKVDVAQKKANGGATAGATNGDAKAKDKTPAGGHPKWMNDADRQKAEARKAKFAAPAPSKA